MADAPALLLGPLLRRVEDTCATVWVETDRPCTVRVRAGAASTSGRTWSVHGHHFAVLVLRDLQPGTTTPYGVDLDGAAAWPSADPELAAHPPSTIRTGGQDAPFRLAFGSCRRSEPLGAAGDAAVGADALVALADRLRTDPGAAPPDLLFMVGDQLYADEPSEGVRRRLADSQRPDAESGGGAEDVRTEICTFEEYTWLYSESWRQAPARWLLADPLLRAVQEAPDDEARDALVDAFALRADADADSARWSFARDLGPGRGIRLVAVDCRTSRRLDPGHRAILDDAEWAWVRDQVTSAPDGGRVEHLLLASTLPVLLVHGFSDVEGWNEAVVAGAWGRWLSGPAERLRRAVDMEHWPAFRASLDSLVDLFGQVTRREDPPASILVLSGDVHCSYTARAHLDGAEHPGTAVHQLVMSPFRNPLKPALRWANRVVQRPAVRALCRALAASAGVPRPAMRWELEGGPWFDNGVMTVVLDGEDVRVEVDHVRVGRDGHVLRRTTVRSLT